MPKSPSRTSKKKKYNARFPPARIKKIMQTDEDVGKVAAAVPVIISRALEMFIESLILETSKTTIAKNAKTLSTSHIKHTIHSNKQFDFLRDVVANVSDYQAEDNCETAASDGDMSIKKGRGRPRKTKDSCKSKQTGESSKTTSDTEEDEEEDDEDTETDEESASAQAAFGHSNDRLKSEMPATSSGSDQLVNNSVLHNLNSGYPHPLISPALASLHKQQQQLLPHQQFKQQLYPPPVPAFPYPSYVPPATLGASNYPLVPPFPNTYPPLVPSSVPHPGHQHPGHLEQPQDSVQQQPINLSYQSRAMATTAGDTDDYDT
ncbi:dr1-associated corepressor-like [Physella acuta]|uniref:dr1-associated corepressor-like n=1 Tax=Physella acuta TaxID=109671 RepID=UPI0027DD2B14|nr:dr1-associated corepressor-like [Physella acuta]